MMIFAKKFLFLMGLNFFYYNCNLYVTDLVPTVQDIVLQHIERKKYIFQYFFLNLEKTILIDSMVYVLRSMGENRIFLDKI